MHIFQKQAPFQLPEMFTQNVKTAVHETHKIVSIHTPKQKSVLIGTLLLALHKHYSFYNSKQSFATSTCSPMTSFPQWIVNIFNYRSVTWFSTAFNLEMEIGSMFERVEITINELHFPVLNG